MAIRLIDRIPFEDIPWLFNEEDAGNESNAFIKLFQSLAESLGRTDNGLELASNLNCYFSPPNNERLRYPCLILEFQNFNQREADNRKYISNVYLTMTFISNNGRLAYASKNVLSIPYCSFDRYFKTDHLHHMVYRLYIKDDLNG